MTAPVLIVRTGTANLASVLAGLRRAGAEGVVTDDAGAVAAAARVVLPGVGAFGAAMPRIAPTMREAVAARVREGRPTLAICLGMQLLCEASEESPGVAGLGVVPATVTRFGSGVRIPQLGWNRVEPDRACRLLEPGFAYFANSYRILRPPSGWLGAESDHGGPFVAALERGPVLLCQFHPELSGPWGRALLQRWLAAAARAA